MRFRSGSTCTVLLLLASMLVACGGPGNSDAGSDATNDGPPGDVGGDAPNDVGSDGTLDATPDGTPDATPDATPDMIVPPDGGTGIVCDPGTPCGALDSCELGFTCVTNACGLKTCRAVGATCADVDECASGSICEIAGFGGMVCRPDSEPLEVCNASTDCPVGSACEGSSGSRACVRRFLPCMAEEDCPRSFACLPVDGDSLGCLYIYRPCTTLGACRGASRCGDVDGDGDSECGGGGSCDANSQCTPGERCVFTGAGIQCGLGGLCTPAGTPCSSGFQCTDLWGDGYFECVPNGGSCDAQTDCGAGQVCAVPADGSPPHCFAPM